MANYEVITLSDIDLAPVTCFACSACNKCSAGRNVISQEKKNYCWKCFENIFGIKCIVCRKSITGSSELNFIYYNSKVWHQECFTCTNCKKLLSEKDFVEKGNLYCTSCSV